jgi:hypothetical protein
LKKHRASFVHDTPNPLVTDSSHSLSPILLYFISHHLLPIPSHLLSGQTADIDGDGVISLEDFRGMVDAQAAAAYTAQLHAKANASASASASNNNKKDSGQAS